MRRELVQVETPDGVADAYLARPEGAPRPAVLLMPDAFGLRPAIEQMADRIAGDGYAVLAPNVFYRAGRTPVEDVLGPPGGERPPDAFRKVLPLIQELTPERMASDGDSYLEFLRGVAAPGRAAVAGFCMGGRLAWRIAASHPARVAALAAFHTAGLVGDDADSPHRSAADLKPVELYFGFADQDRGATPEQIATLERALEAAGVRYVAEVYEGAHHGYAVPDTAAYDAAAAERQRRALRALLRRTLG